MLLITLLAVLVGVIALSYYNNKEYFQNASIPKPGAVGLGINKSYGTMGVKDAQLGNNDVVYDPITNSKKVYTEQPHESIILQRTKNSIHPRPTINNQDAKYGPSGLHNIKGSMSAEAAAEPQRHDVQSQVTVSDTGFSALELQNKSALLNDIQKIVKQELLLSRNEPTNNPIAMRNQQTDGREDTDSTQQGSEFRSSRQDMSKFIRKDSIPCWGCSLDY